MRAIESRPSLQYPKDARAITQVHTFIFDVRHTDTKSQLNTPESQLRSLHSLAELTQVDRTGYRYPIQTFHHLLRPLSFGTVVAAPPVFTDKFVLVEGDSRDIDPPRIIWKQLGCLLRSLPLAVIHKAKTGWY